MQCRFITMNRKIQQNLTSLTTYFSPDFTFFSGLIQLVWSIWELPNLNTLTGQRSWSCLGLTITLNILCCLAENYTFQKLVVFCDIFDCFLKIKRHGGKIVVSK